jgi:hypothetical protein
MFNRAGPVNIKFNLDVLTDKANRAASRSKPRKIVFSSRNRKPPSVFARGAKGNGDKLRCSENSFPLPQSAQV